MPRISPFTGLLFDEARVGPIDRVTAPPYDIVDAGARRRLAEASDHNVVRLDLSEPRPGDDEVDNEYTRAASLLGAWRRDGALRATDRPSWFLYEMRFAFGGEGRRVRGVVCAVDLEAWGGSIIPHERTMPGPVEDRLRLLRTLRTNLSPVYSLFPGPRRSLSSFLDDVMASPGGVDMTDEEGVRHRLWDVAEHPPDLPTEEPLLIADGHHRYTTALRYRDEMRASSGPGPWDRLMMLLVDAAMEEPPVLPIHRVVPHGHPRAGGEAVRDLDALLPELDDEAGTYGVIAGRGAALAYRVARVKGDPPVVRALHREVLVGAAPGALRYTHDPAEAEAAVRAGAAPVAYLLPPTSSGRIREVIEAGERMPEKSTFFWPKPRTGMVLRPLDSDQAGTSS